MHGLIVVAHPKPQSFTHAIAKRIGEGLLASDAEHTYEIADIAQEGFDPRFTANDIAVLLREAAPSPDIIKEQVRIDRASALALVYPVYWWSMPALLKGWIDRVFTNAWAYDDTGNEEKIVKKLTHLRLHLVAIGGASMRTYARHGYFGAMKTQINHGIFHYCGAQVATSELLLQSDADFPNAHFQTAHKIGLNFFAKNAV